MTTQQQHTTRALGPRAAQMVSTIRRLREAQRLTYAEMAKQLMALDQPIPTLGLSRIERGERRLDIDEIHAIATVLGVKAENLWQASQCGACLGTPPAGFSCNTCEAGSR